MMMSNHFGVFHPVEHAILSDWLGVERPDFAKAIDIWDEVESYDDPPTEDCIRLRPQSFGPEEEAVANAVARLVLQWVQTRLPQWVELSTKGELILGRAYEKAVPRSVRLMPQFLLEINWATGWMGMTWPEAYHVTYLPYYHRLVVTCSRDSDDGGYADNALGHFDAESPLMDECKHIITQKWTRAKENGQPHWSEFLREGSTGEEDAYAWAGTVWPQDPNHRDRDLDAEPDSADIGCDLWSWLPSR
jgi:hypothetical protein